MAAPGSRLDSRYSLHADAGNLFSFLKQSFFKMPRLVQVIGWLVFLLLFVFLVLYPLLGITYYEGHIVLLSIDQEKQPKMSPASGIQIYKGGTTTTNDHGDFTVGIRTPDIPFMKVDFEFNDQIAREEVSVPAPAPFVSLFNPNRRKIFYVPSSNIQDSSGLFVRHYFLDETEARDALKKSIIGASPGVPPDAGHSRVQGHGSGAEPLMSGVVYAAEQGADVRSYTLQIRDLKIPRRQDAAEVYFDVRIDGRALHVDNLPDANSSQAKDLTVFGDTSTRVDALSIPVPDTARRVEISTFERRSFYQKDPLIGTVTFDIGRDKLAKSTSLSGGNIEMTVELLPAAAIRCTSTTAKTGKYIIGELWLDIRPDDQLIVDKLQYDLGRNFEHRYVSPPEIESSRYYQHAISMFVPQAIQARVDFIGGSTRHFTVFCGGETALANSPLEHYFLASAYDAADKDDDALREVKISRTQDPGFVPALVLEGNILGKLRRFDLAAAAFGDALRLSPNDAALLNSYAWLVADELPQPRMSQLIDAKKRSEQAVRIDPSPNNLDTLGWVEFKLREYDKALAALRAAQSLQAKRSLSSDTWLEIEYHLGNIYKSLGKKAEARQQFQAVIDFGQKYGRTKPEYAQMAMAEVRKSE